MTTRTMKSSTSTRILTMTDITRTPTMDFTPRPATRTVIRMNQSRTVIRTGRICITGMSIEGTCACLRDDFAFTYDASCSTRAMYALLLNFFDVEA